MALDTYTGLQASIAGFLNRDDLTAVIPDFITLAEAQINRDVRHWRMESRAQINADARYEDLPIDWVETIRVTVSTQYRALRLMPVDQMARQRAENGDVVGPPQYYAHVAGQIEFFPTPDSVYTGEIVYYAKVDPLTAEVQTNWLLADSPDLYLYGSLLQTAPYLQDDARLTVWASLYSAAVSRLNNASNAARWSGTALRRAAPR